VVADRFDRRLIAGLTMVLDALIALVLTLATYNHALSLPLLFAMAAAHGTSRVFIGPALSSIAPNIVPAELMPRAVAINAMAWQIGSMGGRPLPACCSPWRRRLMAVGGAAGHCRVRRLGIRRFPRRPKTARRTRSARLPTASASWRTIASCWVASRSISLPCCWAARRRCCRSMPEIS
jgi:MFS family permease